MKNTIKLSIWAALIVVASQTNAADPKSNLEISKIGSKTFELTMNNLKGEVELSFTNEANEIIYNAKLSHNGSLKKTFDMRNFSDGTYKIEWVDAEKKQLLPVVIEEDVLSIKMQEKITQLFPTLKEKQNIVSVNMLALNGEFLSVRILNASNELVHKETLRGEGSLGKKYDLSNAPKGEYEFQLISDGNVIIKDVTID